MAISYPISLPTTLGVGNIRLYAENVGSISQSPFTFDHQVFKHPGERWTASVSLPPMKRIDAEPWVAALLSLRGQYGTFLLGDPVADSPQGGIEVQRNLFINTTAFSNAYWSKVNSSVAVNGSAWNLIEDTTVSVNHYINKFMDFTAGVPITISIKAKSGSGDRNLNIFSGAGAFGSAQQVSFNLTTGVITNVSGTSVGSISGPDASGFYRCSYYMTPTTTVGANIGFYLSSGTAATYTGNGTSYNIIQDPQFEVGTLTTYQKTISNFGPTPLVNGAGQTGESLVVDNLQPSTNGLFLPGDYIQLGTGSSSKLHKILTQVDSNSSGQATIDIWPRLKSSPADNATVSYTTPKGKFRLSRNTTQWEINNISSYGITFDCVEA